MIKKFILCGCESGGREFLSVVGENRTAYFCDDKYKGQLIDGVEVIGFDELQEIHKAYNVVITNQQMATQFAVALSSKNIPFNFAFGSGTFFNFWKRLYELSLKGMNIGGGGNVFESGEFFALQIMKNNFGLPATPILFDVGANVGKYTLMLADLFPNAEIHSFEPGHSTFATLNDNVKSRGGVWQISA